MYESEPLHAYNTLALDSTPASFATVANDAKLGQACAWARAQGLPVIPLGQGSNVVFAGALNALVLRVATQGINILKQTNETVLLRVSAGQSWHEFVEWTLQQGYFGLENLALIPGTVGAAPIQNIGAYGVEFERFVRAVHVLMLSDGSTTTLSADECEFAYRESVFKNGLRDQVVVTAVDIELYLLPAPVVHYPALAEELARSGISQPQPGDVFRAVVEVRSRRLPDPAIEPNAGSFFKNPVIEKTHAQALAGRYIDLPQYTQSDGSVKLPAAWLIEQCGFKGKRQGAFGIHPKHALVMVNYGGGKGAELLDFAAAIAASVQLRFGVQLHMEPRVYGLNA